MKKLIYILMVAVSVALAGCAGCAGSKQVNTAPIVDSAIRLVLHDSVMHVFEQMGIEELREYLTNEGVSYSATSTLPMLVDLARQYAWVKYYNTGVSDPHAGDTVAPK